MSQKYYEENDESKKISSIAHHVKEILKLMGENTHREGLIKTPERAAKALNFLTMGSKEESTVAEILQSAVFPENYEEMVLVKDIEFYSLCEHHMLPFYGKAHVAYIPNNQVVGLSKIARVVDIYSRQLQIQEKLTVNIRDAIQSYLNPQGVAVLIEARHMCMMIRGVQKQHSVTVTSALSGQFLTDPKTREEFMHLVHKI